MVEYFCLLGKLEMHNVPMPRRDNWLIFLKALMWLGLVQGIIWALLTLSFATHTLIYIGRSVTTTGTVVELHENHDDDVGVTYAPVFTFVLKNGSTQTITSNAGTNPPAFEVGDKISVRYEPGDPSDAAINSIWQTWAFSVGFGIASVVMTLFGLFFRWCVARRKARPRKLQKIQSLEQI